jgi:hypothetical protein
MANLAGDVRSGRSRNAWLWNDRPWRKPDVYQTAAVKSYPSVRCICTVTGRSSSPIGTIAHVRRRSSGLSAQEQDDLCHLVRFAQARDGLETKTWDIALARRSVGKQLGFCDPSDRAPPTDREWLLPILMNDGPILIERQLRRVPALTCPR